MIFVPPQHGKSEILSRNFPAWAFGYDPDLKIVGCSYSSDLAKQFSRSIQRIMDSPEYLHIFPETRLNSSNLRTVTRGYLRNVDMFEIVNHKGFYKAQGVCGSLTGTAVDIAIIDDPVKDAIEAYSPTYRERVWEWYTSVLLTRLHNNSRQLFIMTRWHEDDLAGRILSREADKWEVCQFLPYVRLLMTVTRVIRGQSEKPCGLKGTASNACWKHRNAPLAFSLPSTNNTLQQKAEI